MAQKKRFFDNVEFNKKGNFLIFAVNPQLFSIQTIFSAAYAMLDRAFAIIDGQPDSLVVVSLRPKKGKNLEALASEFSEQLLNYEVNRAQSVQTKAMREELMKRVFLTQAGKGA